MNVKRKLLQQRAGCMNVFLVILFLFSANVMAVGRAFVFPETVVPDANGIARFSVSVEGVDAPGLRSYAYELDFVDSGVVRLVEGSLATAAFGGDISNFPDKISCSTKLLVTAPQNFDFSTPTVPNFSLQSGQGQMMLDSSGSDGISCAVNKLIDGDTGQYSCGAAGTITGQTGDGVVTEYVCYVGPDVPDGSVVNLNLRKFVNAAGNELTGVVRLDEGGGDFVISDLTSARIVIGDLAVKSDTPTINPVKVQDTTVSGTSTEAAGTIIKLFINGSEVDTHILGTIITTVTVDTDGAWTANFLSGLASGDVVTATATADGETESDQSIAAVFENRAPIADDDGASTNEDTSTIIFVLDGDSDAEDANGIPAGAVNITQPENGTAVVNADRKVTYTPNPDFFGNDSFTYTVEDGDGAVSNIATVSISVVAVNDAPVANDDSGSTAEDTATSIAVLGNDTDEENDTLTIASVTQGSNGSVAINGSNVVYTPNADFFGSDTFTYIANDGVDDSNSAIVQVTISSVNDAPVANDDSGSTAEDTATSIAVLSNDTDVENDSLTIASVTQGTNGSVEIDGSNVVYTPNADFFGSDSFTYIANDGLDDSNVATVLVEVGSDNDAPVAVDDNAGTTEDSAVEIKVLTNDTDTEDLGGIPLGVVDIIAEPAKGTYSVNGGIVTYTPNQDENGDDSFTYQVKDGNGADSNVATVSIVITAINDAPEANDDIVRTNEDTAVDIFVVDNDSDVEDADQKPAGAVRIVDSPVNGELSIDANVITYTPSLNFNGEDGFSYIVKDGNGADSNEAFVTIHVDSVNDDPIIIISAPSNVETGFLVEINASDTKDVEDDTLTFAWVLTTPGGSLATLNNTTISKPVFTPDEPGTYELELTVTDSNNGFSTKTIQIEAADPVIENVGPNAVIIPTATNVLLNSNVELDGSTSSDTDEYPNPELSYFWELLSQPAASNGLTSFDTPLVSLSPDVAGDYIVQLTVSDGELESTAQVTIIAAKVNIPPVASAGDDQIVELGQNVVVDGVNSFDEDGDDVDLTFKWSFVKVPSESNIVNQSLTSPENISTGFMPDVPGEYILKLLVTDLEPESTSDQVSITVNPVQEPVEGDLNDDGAIGLDDYQIFRSTLGKCEGAEGYLFDADYNGDGCINALDYRIWYGFYRYQATN